jgi:hypothetical protein
MQQNSDDDTTALVSRPDDGTRREDSVRQAAETALSVLLDSAAEPVDRATSSGWAQEVPVFERIALCADEFIVTIEQPATVDREYRLFVAATEDLSDEEYLACIDISSATIGHKELP